MVFPVESDFLKIRSSRTSKTAFFKIFQKLMISHCYRAIFWKNWFCAFPENVRTQERRCFLISWQEISFLLLWGWSFWCPDCWELLSASCWNLPGKDKIRSSLSAPALFFLHLTFPGMHVLSIPLWINFEILQILLSDFLEICLILLWFVHRCYFFSQYIYSAFKLWYLADSKWCSIEHIICNDNLMIF